MKNTELNPEQQKAIMEVAWAILTKTAKEKQTIKITNFDSSVQASSGVSIDRYKSQALRHNCNLRSIKEKGCVIEVIIVREDNTPDNRTFEMAWSSNVYTLPEKERGVNFDRMKAAKKLQQQVYDAFGNQ